MQKTTDENAYINEFRVQSSVKYATYQNIFTYKCVFSYKKSVFATKSFYFLQNKISL